MLLLFAKLRMGPGSPCDRHTSVVYRHLDFPGQKDKRTHYKRTVRRSTGVIKQQNCPNSRQNGGCAW